MHTEDYFRGQAFLNHISLLYYYDLLNTLRNAGIIGKFSVKEVLKLTKNFCHVDYGSRQDFKVSAVPEEDKKRWISLVSTDYVKF